jgi:hypothetical protein
MSKKGGKVEVLSSLFWLAQQPVQFSESCMLLTRGQTRGKNCRFSSTNTEKCCRR